MNKKIFTITTLVLIIIFIPIVLIKATYSMINDLSKNEDIDIAITLEDIFVNDDGIYNKEYYDVIKELELNGEETMIIFKSYDLNRVLNKVINENDKITESEIYDLIKEAVYSDSRISNELKSKIINKSRLYLKEIKEYLLRY